MTVYILEEWGERTYGGEWSVVGVVQEWSVASEWYNENTLKRSVTEFILDQIN